MTPNLSVVAERAAKPQPSVAERMQALQAEARRLATDHAGGMLAALTDLQALAAEIAAGGEAYPPGVRAVARDVAMACERHGQTLQAINGRAL